MTNPEQVKKFLDACFLAKEITQMMPPLPNSLSPRHFYILDCIKQLADKQTVKISDISETLRVTKPSITKLINELHEKGIVEKTQDAQDKRIFWLQLTHLGKQYHQQFLVEYHQSLAQKWAQIGEVDFQTTIDTLTQAYQLMQE